MNSVFSVNVKYLKLVEGGEGYKKVNDVILVNAVSYTDVEAKITEEMQMRTKEEFYIANIKREKYSYVPASELPEIKAKHEMYKQFGRDTSKDSHDKH